MSSEGQTPTTIIKKPQNVQTLDDTLMTLKHAIRLGANVKSLLMCVDGWAEAEEAAKKIIILGHKIIMIAASAVIYMPMPN